MEIFILLWVITTIIFLLRGLKGRDNTQCVSKKEKKGAYHFGYELFDNYRYEYGPYIIYSRVPLTAARLKYIFKNELGLGTMGVCDSKGVWRDAVRVFVVLGDLWVSKCMIHIGDGNGKNVPATTES